MNNEEILVFFDKLSQLILDKKVEVLPSFLHKANGELVSEKRYTYGFKNHQEAKNVLLLLFQDFVRSVELDRDIITNKVTLKFEHK